MLAVRVIARVATCLVLIASTARAQQAVPDSTIRTIDVGGHAVRVHVQGLEARKSGEPVIVFEAGATNALEVWSRVLPDAAALAPVVAYDRAGLGRSEWDGQTPTPRHVATRLREVLRQVGAEPPYVLVGYSWGGSLARWFAGYYPAEIAGAVFVDPGPIVTMTRAETLAPYDSVGAGRAGYDAFWSGFATFFSRSPPAVHAEFDVFRGIMDVDRAERDLRPMPPVPVVVLVAGKYQPLPASLELPYDPRSHFEVDVRHRVRMLQDWALASPHGMLVVSNHITHAIPREDPALIVWAVKQVLSAVPVAPPGTVRDAKEVARGRPDLRERSVAWIQLRRSRSTSPAGALRRGVTRPTEAMSASGRRFPLWRLALQSPGDFVHRPSRARHHEHQHHPSKGVRE